ncbi:Tn3 transposase DDE domain-containing protein [Actinopolyspora mzabensis]|uniref:Tn3 transposase DDE domain-containing protein n=1 Tax=Actinopolyspora mzabensis TaxID=995066 RepID=A0A1G8Y0M3_ACTMZ|nr:Tn3 transposase DDE domain-containing protein [Actinopolyspora mzabensis]
MLALYLLQSASVHVNTLLLQHALHSPGWDELLGPAERRALSPLFWFNINPYGRFRLDMTTRLDFGHTRA